MTVADSDVEAPGPHRVTVEEFGRMVDAGVFDPDARLELVEGEILEMSPMNSPHAFAGAKLAHFFAVRLDERAAPWSERPIVCGELSRPQPDVALVKWPFERYVKRLPTADDVLLVVEVADSSVRSDRSRKIPLYGQFGVPEAWLVDVRGHSVEVLTKPGPDGYEQTVHHTADDTLAPEAFPDVQIAVAELFPKR